MAQATEKVLNLTNDEDYVISQVLNYLTTDKATAKSWMIFSKFAFPQNFLVLFQSYKMECEEGNLVESAHCLCDLVCKFPNELNLVKELKIISKSLCLDNNDFLKQIFEQLPEDIKYEVMLTVTQNAQSVEEHCELMLLFLKRMPNSRLLQHGRNIIETLLGAEENIKVSTPINMFRKMLVYDALPLVLRISQFDHKFKIMFTLLQKALEFYISCFFIFPTNKDASIRKEAIPNNEDHPDECWKPLLMLLESVAFRYRWSYPEMYVSNFSESSLQQLLSLLKRKNKTLASLGGEKHRREEMSGYEEAYFCLVVTFFYYLYNFGRMIFPKMISSNSTAIFNYVLMEGIVFPQDECYKTLKPEYKRTDRGYMTVSRFATQDVANMLIPSFITTVECYQMLHKHHHLKKEFNTLCSNIKLDTWPVFQEFYISMLIYDRGHREAIQHLNSLRDNSNDICLKDKSALQIASCYNYLGDYDRGLNILFEIIQSLPQSQTSLTITEKPSLSKCSTRFLYFMALVNHDILQYCLSLVLKQYKLKDKIDDSFRDMVLGYTLVMMQYDLDNEYQTLQRVVDMIKKSKGLSFPKFFNYVINVNILEEISYLASLGGGAGMNLEILPTTQASKQRAITRGVNKGARDDLKQAFVNQMAHCYDNLDNIFINFIKEEHSFLLLPLKD